MVTIEVEVSFTPKNERDKLLFEAYEVLKKIVDPDASLLDMDYCPFCETDYDERHFSSECEGYDLLEKIKSSVKVKVVE